LTQTTKDDKSQAKKSVKFESINSQMTQSYLDYAYSVIIGRAIPDVRDGLKPVQRRIIYSMHTNKFTHTNPYKKCARIVGDVLGKYHPHGDSSVYDALVRMAQEFSLRYPLIEGQGNFGSIDGDPPAAMRYTEARMDVISSELIADIDKDTVEFVPNFDESLKEPVYMPAKIPNLLINGASGIAVGMSTNMLPFNLREVVHGITAVIDNPHMYPEELSQFIKGPDFPTQGMIMGRKGIRNILSTGRGKVIVRGRVELDDKQIIITEIPYLVNKQKLVENIAHLINNKKIRSVSDLRDESNREGIRVVLDLRKDADPNAIKHQLFMMTRLQSSYSVLNRVLIDNNGLQPAVLNILALIKAHIDNREQVIIRRTQYDLKHAKKRLHIIDGLLIAIANIDEIVQIIKSATDTADARAKLMKKYSLSEEQTNAILEMPLRRLTSLQTQKLQEEKIAIGTNVLHFEEILVDKKLRMKIIKDELVEIDKKYGDDRKTEILDVPEDFAGSEEEQLKVIPEETCVIMLTQNQYIKRMTLETYQSQNRGGKGKKGINKRDEDIIRDVYVVSSHDKVLLFTRKGRVYSKYAYEIPLMSRTSQGKALVNFVGLKPEEEIVHMVPVVDFTQDDFLVFVSKRGMVKRTNVKEFKNIRKTGILAIGLRENDELVDVKRSEGDQYILIATEHGYAIKFSDLELRSLSRKAMGVVGIRLREADNVVEMVIGDNNTDVITITKNGYGKRSKVELYRETRRGGKGVINIKFRDLDDCVNSMKAASDEELLIATTNGIIIRVPSLSLRSLSRSAKGVRVIDLNEGDSVSSVALCERSDENGEENGEEESETPKSIEPNTDTEEQDTAKPEEQDTAKPEEQDTTKLEEQDTTKPEEQDTTKPEEQDTTKLEEQDTTKPEEQDTTKLEEQDTTKLEEQDTTKPEEQDTTKPEEQDTTKPEEQEEPEENTQ